MKLRKDLPNWAPMFGRKVCLDYKGIKKQCSACFGPHIRKFCLSKSLMTPPRYTPHPPNNHFFVARFSPFNFCLLIIAFNFASTFFHSISAIHFLLLNFNLLATSQTMPSFVFLMLFFLISFQSLIHPIVIHPKFSDIRSLFWKLLNFLASLLT